MICIWNLATMRQVDDPLQGHTYYMRSVAVYDGKIVSGSDDMTIRISNMATMEQVDLLETAKLHDQERDELIQVL